MDYDTRKLLEDCATQFQYYADLHAAKPPSFENQKKVDANVRWVTRIRKHLDGTT